MTPEQIKMLQAKLDPSHVKQREQAGRLLSYVESWHAIAEANRIFGFDGWSSETVDIKCVHEKERKIGRPPNQRDGWTVTYTARVRVTIGPVVRDGVGSGHGIDVDLGLAHESAIKEAESDSRKRALMTFGNPFGLALYDKTRANVGDPEPEGPTESEKRILATMTSAIALAKTLPDLKVWWAEPENQRAFRMLPADMQRQVEEAKEQRKAALTTKVAA